MAEYKNVEELTYKEASTELELIIRSRESGNMELEESLESSTRGVELLKSLRARVACAEQKAVSYTHLASPGRSAAGPPERCEARRLRRRSRTRARAS